MQRGDRLLRLESPLYLEPIGATPLDGDNLARLEYNSRYEIGLLNAGVNFGIQFVL